MRDRALVAGRVKDSENASGGDRREEVLEVEAQDRLLRGVQPCVADDGAAASEAVRGIVRRDLIEDLAQQPPLDLFEASLRGLDHPRQPVAAHERPVAVVAQPRVEHGALQAAHVGQPRELPWAQLEPLGERLHRVDRGDRPGVQGAPLLGRQQPDDPRRLRIPGSRWTGLQECLDQAGQLRGAFRRRRAVDGHDPQRQRVHPGWPAIETACAALGDLLGAPRPLQEHAGKLARKGTAFGCAVHAENDRGAAH